MACTTPPTAAVTVYHTPPRLALKDDADVHIRKRLRTSPTPPNDSPRPEAAPKTEVDIEAVWHDALVCKEVLNDEIEADRVQPFAMARLPNGDVHVCCKGQPCPFLHPNEDRILVCEHTGLEHGPEDCSEFYDVSGGTGKKSGDPDINCGEQVYGGFQRRIDPIAASRAAFMAAGQLDDTEIFSVKDKKSSKKQAKRGARCVDEDPCNETSRRSRLCKRNIADRDTCSGLQVEAESVLNKLVNFKSAPAYKKGERSEKPQSTANPRMCDPSALFQAALRKYLRQCIAEGVAPSLDTVHNIGLIAESVSQKAREVHQSNDDHGAIRTATFRQRCSGLIVALWIAVCDTPYMKAEKRNADAFRPFVAGCIYAFKRGVALADNSPLIPPCPQLAAALPVLRGTGGNVAAKTLHSSSHRGLCTLSRCIASVAPEDQPAIFGGVTRMAREFASLRFSRSDV